MELSLVRKGKWGGVKGLNYISLQTLKNSSVGPAIFFVCFIVNCCHFMCLYFAKARAGELSCQGNLRGDFARPVMLSSMKSYQSMLGSWEEACGNCGVHPIHSARPEGPGCERPVW